MCPVKERSKQHRFHVDGTKSPGGYALVSTAVLPATANLCALVMIADLLDAVVAGGAAVSLCR